MLVSVPHAGFQLGKRATSIEASDVAEFTSLLYSLPPNSNVYLELAGFLKKKSSLPKNPLWASILLVVFLLLHLTMIFSASWIILLHFRNGKFRLFGVTSDRIIRPHAHNCFAVLCIIYSTLTIVEMTLQVSLDLGGSAAGPLKSILQGIAGLMLWLGGWCFCHGHLVQFVREKYSHGEEIVGAGEHCRTPFAQAMVLNFIFIVSSFLIALWVMCCSFKVYYTSVMLQATISVVIKNLIQKAPSYNSSTFNIAQLVPIVLPLTKLKGDMNGVLYNAKGTIFAFLGGNTLMLIILIALIIFGIQRWKSAHPHHKHEVYMTKDVDVREELSSLFWSSGTIIAVEIIVMPLMTWQIATMTTENMGSLLNLLMREIPYFAIATLVANFVLASTLLSSMRTQPFSGDAQFVCADARDRIALDERSTRIGISTDETSKSRYTDQDTFFKLPAINYT